MTSEEALAIHAAGGAGGDYSVQQSPAFLVSRIDGARECQTHDGLCLTIELPLVERLAVCAAMLAAESMQRHRGAQVAASPMCRSREGNFSEGLLKGWLLYCFARRW